LLLGYLTVTPDDLDVWARYPDATFTLVIKTADEHSVGEEYCLGAFNIGNPEQ
jgi:hypothetical protein